MTTTENEKVNGTRQDVVYVTAMYVTIMDEYTHTGEVTDFSSSSVSYKMSGSNANKDAKFASGCEFYIGDKKSDVDDLENWQTAVPHTSRLLSTKTVRRPKSSWQKINSRIPAPLTQHTA